MDVEQRTKKKINTNMPVVSLGLLHLCGLKAWLLVRVLSSECHHLEYSKVPSVLFPAAQIRSMMQAVPHLLRAWAEQCPGAAARCML